MEEINKKHTFFKQINPKKTFFSLDEPPALFPKAHGCLLLSNQKHFLAS